VGAGNNCVHRAVDAAREVCSSWRHVDVRRRLDRMCALRNAVVERLDSIVAAVCKDTGKVRAEALLTDLLPSLEQMLYYEGSAVRTLSTTARPGTLLFPGVRASVEYQPYGVVLVIAPWNNPFQLSLVPASTALLAGNAVIIKPSERTPTVAAELLAVLSAATLAPPLVQVIQGGPETARRLVATRPDLVFFTGGIRGGREILRLASEHLIPTVLELGGKDPMVVFADADLERATNAAVYGAFAHDGRHCVSVERLYVEEPACETVAQAVARGASHLSRGRDLSAFVDPGTEARIGKLVAEAIKKGARLLTRCKDNRPSLPVVLAEVDHGMAVMREETFGPLLTVTAFRDEAQAIALANDSDYGLNASVWSGDSVKARRVASQLESGSVCINNVLVNAGHPALPFGGVKRSGFGRYHGPEGLLTFTQPRAVFEQEGHRRRELHWFPYGRDLDEMTEQLLHLRYGRRAGVLERVLRWLELARRRRLRQRSLARNPRNVDPTETGVGREPE